MINSRKERRKCEIANQTVTSVHNIILMKLEIGSCSKIKFFPKASDKKANDDLTRTDRGKVTTDNQMKKYK